MKKIAWGLCALASAAAVVYLAWLEPRRADDVPAIDPRQRTSAPSGGELQRGHTRNANGAERRDVESADEPAQAHRAAPLHRPGMGPVVPFDITNTASESLGHSLWMQWTNDPAAWGDLWRALHKRDHERRNPLDDPPEPHEFDPAQEGVLAIGLGERPRMDYGFTLEPIASKYGEARYLLKVFEVPSSPVEVKTYPARVWLLPLQPQLKGGLTIADEHGNELRHFEPLDPRANPPDEDEDNK